MAPWHERCSPGVSMGIDAMGTRATMATALLLGCLGLGGCRQPAPDPEEPEPPQPFVPEAVTSGGEAPARPEWP